jgi:hypothetical protein
LLMLRRAASVPDPAYSAVSIVERLEL